MNQQLTVYHYLTTLGLRVYQLSKIFVFSLFALYSPGTNCRHSPTCSVYAKRVITQHGIARGGFMALKRLFSCHPFHFKIKKLT